MKRFRAVDKVTGKQVYGADLKLPGHAQCDDQGMPGVRRQGEELRRRQGRRHEGRQEGPAGRRHRRRGRRRHLVAGQGRARRAADRLGRGPECEGLERLDRRDPEGRSRRRAGLRRQPERRRQGGDRKRREEGRGGLLLSVPEPRPDGADERHRALHAGQVRGVGPDAGRRSVVRGGARRVRPAGRQVRRAQDRPRRRLRPARRVPGLRASGCPHRQGDAGHADQAALVARGGHGAGPLSPGHDGQDGRRVRQGQQPDRPAHPPVGTVDPRERASAGRWSRRRGAIRSRSRVCSRRASIRSATRSRTC